MKKNLKPIFNYFGSKWHISRKLIGIIPPHHTYCEPFCGTAAMLLAKNPSYVEIINDLNSNITNLFRVIRDPKKLEKIIELVEFTPYSREEYKLALKNIKNISDPVEKAYLYLIISNMGYAGKQKYSTGFKTGYSEFRSINVWNKIPERIQELSLRFKNVQIENKPAIELIKRTDTKNTFFFIDPPYPKIILNNSKNMYEYTLTDKEHEVLIDILANLEGKVIVTIYENDIYDKLLENGYHKKYIKNIDLNHKLKIETIYMNYHYIGSLFKIK